MDQHLSPSEFLTREELRDLTGAGRAQAQARWLAEKGLPHRVDGRRVIVSRHHVRQWLAGESLVLSAGPNWDAVR